MAEQVIDASLALKWVVRNEPLRQKARQLLRAAQVRGITLIAPPLLEYEIESMLQRSLYNRRSTRAAVDASLHAFYRLGVRIVTHPVMIPRARQIARQFQQQRVYDALYSALAELRGCEFWTADRAFYEAVRAGLPYVKYLADYQ